MRYTNEQLQYICDLKASHTWKEITRKYNERYPEAPRTHKALNLNYGQYLKWNQNLEHREHRSGPVSKSFVKKKHSGADAAVDPRLNLPRQPLGDGSSQANRNAASDAVENEANDEASSTGQATGGTVLARNRKGHQLRQKHATTAELRAGRIWEVYQNDMNGTQKGVSGGLIEALYVTRRREVEELYLVSLRINPLHL